MKSYNLLIKKDFPFIIPILPIVWVQTHIRSVRGPSPCTATIQHLLFQ